MDADYNLLFGVVCLQNKFITLEQFGQACLLWASAQERGSLGDILVDRGWLSRADQSLIVRLVARQLVAEGGNGSVEPAPLAPTTYQPISLEQLEKTHVQRTLEFTDWNKSRTSSILGIERSTLDRKIKSWNLDRP